MVIRTGINVNKNKRVEKMTEEEVKALIQELRDEIPAIVQTLKEESMEEVKKAYEKYLKDNK